MNSKIAMRASACTAYSGEPFGAYRTYSHATPRRTCYGKLNPETRYLDIYRIVTPDASSGRASSLTFTSLAALRFVLYAFQARGHIVAANPPKAANPSEPKPFPMPPIGKWAEWVWRLVVHYRLHKGAAVVLMFLVVALLVPLVVSWALMLAAFVGDKTPFVGEIRNLYVATVQEGFQILHSRIDYVQSFELELGGAKPSKVVVVSDLERGQYVEVVLRSVRVLPLKAAVNTVPALAGPPAPGSSKGCSLADRSRPGHVSPGVLRVSLSGIPIRDPFKETEEPVAVPLDADWWRSNKDEVAKLTAKVATLELLFEKGDIGNRTEPAGCGAVLVEGKIRIYKNRFRIPRV